MTELLGVVAGGIAVAQLGTATGGAILKLKKLWDHVNNAPEIISDLIERLELIYSSVWDFERQCSQPGLPPILWESTTATRSLVYCRKALTRFSNVVDDLSTQITSRRGFRKRMTVFKVALKKDELQRLEEQLRNSLEVLRFAQDAYTRALLTATPDITTRKVQQYVQRNQSTTLQHIEDNRTSPSDLETDKFPKSSTLSHTTEQIKGRAIEAWEPLSSFGTLSIRTGPEELDVEVRPPWWLAGLASSFTLHMSKYRSSWDIQLRLYSDRTENDGIFFMARAGDTVGLQSLFDQRKASPFDRDEGGWNLLHVSYQGTRKKSPEQCINYLSKLNEVYYADIQIQQFILGPEWSTDPKAFCDEIWAYYGFSLLHHITYHFSHCFDLDEREAIRLHEFAKKAMLASDLHPLELGSLRFAACEMVETDITPLIRLMLSQLDWELPGSSGKVQKANENLQRWIEDLIAVGVDIEEYGRKECSILRNIKSMSSLFAKAGRDTWPDVYCPLKGYEIYFYGFTYGPSVGDWTILCEEPTDRFAGEFWNLVEEHPLDMPGAWFD
ncbi:hypothetical protein PG999_008291 [Apiospora kogelbergensis]|uniref:NACHT-NTPase and P-loop NTPases N-terminal domain-containing protein n=1 Tax=Apiospora kogelbergensis TaxID=1337665 RepID=A0AAW0QHA8_9PEZI